MTSKKDSEARAEEPVGRLTRTWTRLQSLAGWRPGSGVLATVQAGISAVVLSLAALGVVLVATDVTSESRRNLPAAVALAAVWWLWRRCAHGERASTIINASEAALLFIALLLEGKGAWVFSTVAFGLFLRAAFGSNRQFLVRGIWWSLAIFGSAVLREAWGWAPWWLRLVDTLWFPPSYLLVGGLIRLVVSVLEHHELALARERVLLGAGVALVSSTSRADIYEVALDAVVELVNRPGIQADISETTVDGSTQIACRRNDLPATATMPAVYQMRLEVRRELVTMITVTSAEPLPQDSVDALQRLESNVALAIRGASLTEDLRRQAHYDALTGLPNRALLYQRLEEALRPDQGEKVALLLIDLDGFKHVNDSLGHEGGDALLGHVGEALGAGARATDTPARLGGDEFAVLLVDLEGEEAALEIADRIVARLSTPVAVDDVEITPRGSIGVALWDGTSRPDELMRAADAAMYSAKSAGKSRSHLFRRSMLTEGRQRMGLEGALRQALDRGELECHYQPIVDARTGAIDSVEALVRWRRPGHGLLLTAEFLRVAEDGGLMPRLGDFVLRRSLEDFAAWRADLGPEAPRRLNVNLSPQELSRTDLVTRVQAALAATGVEPGALVLELSGSTVLADRQTILPNLQALRALGVVLALDDFGWGQSTLAHLPTCRSTC